MSATDSNPAFMLLVWDLTVYARYSEAVTSDQYGDMSNLYAEVWGYVLPAFTGYGA